MLRIAPSVRNFVPTLRRRSVLLLAAACLLVSSLWFALPTSAAITLRNASSANNGGGATSITINAPSGAVAGDVLILSIDGRATSANTGPCLGTSNTWNLLTRTLNGTTIYKSTYYKVLTAAPPASYTIDLCDGLASQSHKASAGLIAYSGVELNAPIMAWAAQTNTSNTTVTAPSVTTTTANAMLVAMYGTATGTTATEGSSMTERYDDASTGAGAGTRTTSAGQDAAQATVGASGTKTMTMGAAAVSVGHTVALRPKLSLQQSAYRWFANADSTTPGTAMAAQDTGASLSAGQTAARLQMTTHITDGMVRDDIAKLKLQYALRGSDNVCDTGFSNETYADIGPMKVGPNNGSTFANDAAVGTVAWNNPANAANSNDSRTTAGLNQDNTESNYLKATNFGFSVPTGATVLGVAVEIEDAADVDSGTEEAYTRAQLIKGGAVTGDVKTRGAPLPTTETYELFGHPTDLWGATLTPADVNASTFGVAVQAWTDTATALTNNVYVDHIRIKVAYSLNGAVQFQQNTTPLDGSAAVNGGVTHGSDTVTTASYIESNNFRPQLNQSIASGVDALWDFSLDFSNTPDGIYCFRVVNQDGTVLNSYSVIPQVTIPSPQLTQANYRWFNNADSSTPGAVLAAQDTAASIAAETPFRLRSRIAVDSGSLAQSGRNLKLQYAEKSVTCDVGFSGETYQDIVSVNSSSARSAATTSNDASYGTTAWASTGAGGDVIGGPSTSYSQYLKSSSHGFSIPASATIGGIEVKITGYSSGFGVTEDRMRLVKGGVIGSVNRTDTGWTNGQVQTYTYGGAADLWGETWAPADINASSFGVAMSAYLESDSGEGSSLFVTDMNIKVYYSMPPGAVSYHNNASVADAVTVSSTGNDPTNASRPTVLQNYREDTPFTNGVATVPVGSDGLWDFALTSSSAASGKTYCLRFVKSDDSPLDTYSQIPEITIGSGPVGPTLDQMTRGGQSVVNGVKNPFSF